MNIRILSHLALLSAFASAAFSMNAQASNLDAMMATVSASCEAASLNDPIAGVYTDGVDGKYVIGVMKLPTGSYTFQILTNDIVTFEFDKAVTIPAGTSSYVYADYSKNSPRGALQASEGVSVYFYRTAGVITNTEFNVNSSLSTKDGTGRERSYSESYSFSYGIQLLKCAK